MGCIQDAGPTGIASGLDVGCEDREELRMGPKTTIKIGRFRREYHFFRTYSTVG